MQDFKDMLKQLFQQMSTMINLLTTVITKLKMANFLRLALWNANGLIQHAEELKTFISLHNIDVMLISETHFTGKVTLNY
jgi:hypothetical protein